MDMELTQEQENIRRLARQLATKEIVPVAAEIDHTGRFPRDVIAKMGDAGLFGILTAAAYGGAGGERLDFLLTAEEIAMASASVASSYVKSMCTGFLIAAFGTEEQKQSYLPSMATGMTLGAFAITETGSGANWVLSMRARARTEDGYYIVDGTKDFISNAGEADVYVVLVRTDPTAGPAGISALIIEKGTPGFSFGTREKKLGLRATPAGELVFDHCAVPQHNRLGATGAGTKVVPPFAALVCAGQAAIAVGIAQAAFEACVRYARERTIAESRTLAQLDGVQTTLADMAGAIEAARLLTYRAVLPANSGGEPRLMLMAAAVAEKMALDVTGAAIGLHGRYGCSTEFPLERYFRDAKTLSLHPVLDTVKLTIGKMLLGLT